MNARITTTILAVLLAAATALAEAPYQVAWTAQIGTSDYDESFSVAVDASGNVYISGYTYGDLGGPNAGSYDAFLSKFDSSGTELWTTQIGTSDGDYSRSVAVDASGDVYISGFTLGDLGGPSAGSGDAFLSKFDSAGNEVWTTQIGTSDADSSWSVAVDASGDVYISGSTHGDLGGPNAGFADAFLSKFDAAGNELWTTQIGSHSWDLSKSVAVDASGDVYISGYTHGDLGGPNAGEQDAFLSKFDTSGNELWTTQIGTGDDDPGFSVAVDASGDVYISGYTHGDLGGPSAGSTDAYLSKFDTSGNELWTTQIGTSDRDYSRSVAVDACGNAYISGYTYGDLGGPSAGFADAFLSKFDSSGNELWTTQMGTDSFDNSYCVAVDASDDVYITGLTGGELGGPSAGGDDAFLVKFAPPLSGDFDGDWDVDTDDIDALGDAVRLGLTDAMYDLSGVGEDGTPDGTIDINDLDYLVHQLVETTVAMGTEYGDFNLDGIIDNTDLTRLATYYGPGTKWSEGNANRYLDLTTDTTDLTILATYYGAGVPDAVPEPATLGLLGLGACLPLFRRKRR